MVPEQCRARKELLLERLGPGLGRGALLAAVGLQLAQRLVAPQVGGEGPGAAVKQPKGGPPVRGGVLVAMAVVEGVEDGQQGGELGGEGDVGRG